MRFLPLILLVLAAALPSVTAADVATVSAARDNTLLEDAEGDASNGAGPAFFAGRNGQGRTSRALLAFDLAGVVPAGARIDSVILALEVSNAPDSSARSFSLHRVLRCWGEGTSSASGGGGAPATPGDATWLHAFFPSDSWSLPGGDFLPAATATQIVGGVGPSAWSGPGLVADVEAWLADPAANHGWLLRGDEGSPSTARRFDSREAVLPAHGPTLTIQYSRPDPTAPLPSSWGRLKSAYR